MSLDLSTDFLVIPSLSSIELRFESDARYRDSRRIKRIGLQPKKFFYKIKKKYDRRTKKKLRSNFKSIQIFSFSLSNIIIEAKNHKFLSG
jgi:hypothetical protein